ncbi:MAG: hypothetical protein SFW65_08125 [Alphaproteobacteria bacterium]|nr:hypothetical protein [Alphaproteobacteria bacterium]
MSGHSKKLAVAALAGLLTMGFSVAPGQAHATTDNAAASDTQIEKHACKGQNSCKGNGGCKTERNACKGQNACKGLGGCATDGSKK